MCDVFSSGYHVMKIIHILSLLSIAQGAKIKDAYYAYGRERQWIVCSDY